MSSLGQGQGQESRSILASKLFARYDALRLQTYKEREGHGERIRIASIGSATLLRFDDVGYFNRIYSPDESIAERLPEVAAFYEGCPFGCELVGPIVGFADRLDRKCEQLGWKPAGRYACLHARIPTGVALTGDSEFAIRQPEIDEPVTFLLTYLRGFEAQPDRFQAAVKNMRHLFELPELTFLMAWKGRQPAGIGMLYRVGKAAFLCAGATLPDQRRQACHASLLAARIRLAMEQGCEEIFSWAAAGSQSQLNMERAGLKTLGIIAAWHFGGQEKAQ